MDGKHVTFPKVEKTERETYFIWGRGEEFPGWRIVIKEEKENNYLLIFVCFPPSGGTPGSPQERSHTDEEQEGEEEGAAAGPGPRKRIADHLIRKGQQHRFGAVLDSTGGGSGGGGGNGLAPPTHDDAVTIQIHYVPKPYLLRD